VVLLDFKKFNKKNILLMCHDHADLDAITSATIFHQILKRKKIKSTISVPKHINDQALNFTFKNKIPFVLNPDLKNYDLVCLFDFNDYEQLGPLEKEFKKLQKKKCFSVITYDHHQKEKRSIGEGYIDSNAGSTTEILYNLFDGTFTKKMCFFTCVGIVEDTGKFLVASKNTFDIFSKCLKKSGKKYSDVLKFIKNDISKGERIAFLKAANRSKIVQTKKAIIVTSNISFYQGDAATKLLEFGANISLVTGVEKKGKTILSARAETLFKEENNFNLMKHLLVPIQKKVGGEVGGHSGAAQWKGKVSEKKVLNEALLILKKKFD
jgi:nanoRNase/pAp phosphatase (c-di-AMP/oligoRNAs hydrolase)